MSPAPAPRVLFDLDGTLVDSEPNYYEAGRRLLARYGVHGFGWEEHTRFIGVSTRETLTALRAEYGIDAPVDELLAGKNALYLELAGTSTEVYPEMRLLVEELHARGVPMAVASGSSRTAIAAVLAVTGLDAFLPLYVSAEEVARGKPAPDVFLEAARRLGAEPASCVVLEDAVPGVEAARAAGMRCVAVPYVEATAGDPAFRGADLLFPRGQREFTAAAVLERLAAGWGGVLRPVPRAPDRPS
ncbi:HAD family hydrolase [Streptomyces halstedii]|uniref:HAD family hydrolase n=1 Tax=Streptomyces TaxID=1883 RepID=UPI00088BE936|nr:HAD family phosphatase [Streptomyces sp. AmelKG-A3]SDC25703.1 haloacid dehalogenase superfamily, subfamily IA, variant 3 with third motif having DD or ED [Streptomyces sp. AmelKG-A3]